MPSVMATSGPKRIIAPEPPANLSQISLPLTEVATTWVRLSAKHHSSPIFWSRAGRYRFDSPTARWGVCYTASSIPAAFQEVFGNKIRYNKPLDWAEIENTSAWHIIVPASIRVLALFGETLTIIGATLQCFVSSYPKSQRWAAVLMDNPSDLDGVVYLGRRCGVLCLALFGDTSSPRKYQAGIDAVRLGDLTAWEELWPMLDRLKVRLSSMPKSYKRLKTSA
jgi:hypothetical protein